MKRDLQLIYIENGNDDLRMFIGEIANIYTNRNFKKIYRKCGYLQSGKFDPSKGYDLNLQDFGFEEPALAIITKENSASMP